MDAIIRRRGDFVLGQAIIEQSGPLVGPMLQPIPLTAALGVDGNLIVCRAELVESDDPS